MGLFRKKTPPQAVPRPLTVDDEDLANAAHLLPRFLVAMDDRGVRMGALAIAEAAGALSLQEATLAQMRTGDSGVDRPWKWLTAVGREAHRQGNGELVAQVALFTLLWVMNVQPKAGFADHMDMKMDDPSSEVLADIYSLALEALPRLDPDIVMVNHPEGVMTAETTLVACAQQALSLGQLLEPGVLESARSYAA
ncbi:hypothetical protein OHT93_36040 [Streptomyces sp. NBC_00191]|uniref:hypothetical protein n=1 Tax=Streptomyces sp. NBC_00191 TaxID=2975674 RepID=UPI00324C7FE4